MWIAKNSITGKTYGKKFKSIYDCQDFINKRLSILEYEFQRVFSLEQQIEEDIKDKHLSFFDIIQKNLDEFKQETGIEEDLNAIVRFTLEGRKQKDLDEELHRLSCTRWQKNNVIRCWNVSQNRFADGFDF